MSFSAFLRGDPHISTPDGLEYEYNGIGEFHLLKSNTIQLQVRFVLNNINKMSFISQLHHFM